MNTHLSVRAQRRIGLGSALAAIGGLLTVLWPLVGRCSFPGPWDLLLGFATGLVSGLGAALAIGGLIERRRERR